MKMSIELGSAPDPSFPPAPAPNHRMLPPGTPAHAEATQLTTLPLPAAPKTVPRYAPESQQRESTQDRVVNNAEERPLSGGVGVGVGAGANDSASSTETQVELAQQESLETSTPESGASRPHDWRPGAGIDAPNRLPLLGDARIRNPIPNKLQHKLNDKDGNFAVMHMDVRKPFVDSPDLAAKRTSEMTQAAAIEATKNGYQSVKRNKLARYPGQITDQRLSDSLTPEVVKYEQSRLLELMRSLHPSLVVDQLCRALAYFGGAPGAPPSTALNFPDSDRMNGSGKAFIGWLAEIFPPMDLENLPQPSWVAVPTSQDTSSNGASKMQERTRPTLTGPATQSLNSAPAVGATAPQKRPRGRPKGSKGRKDKGLGKGELVAREDSAAAELEAPSSSQLPHAAVSSNSAGPVQYPGAHAQTVNDGSSPSITPSKRRRGRPKGSKNRPKPLGADEGGSQLVASPDPTTATADLQSSQPKRASFTQSPLSQLQGFRQSDITMGDGPGMQAALSQQGQTWATQRVLEDPNRTQTTATAPGHSPGRKRKPSMHIQQNSNPRSVPDLHESDDYRTTPVSPTFQRTGHNTVQGGPPGAKRRRTFQDISQSAAQTPSSTHSDASPVNTPTPTLPLPTTTSSAGLVHNTPQAYGSQNPSLGQPATHQANLLQMRRGPWMQQQQQYLQMQQQHQKRTQQIARNDASLNLGDETLSDSSRPSPSSSFVSSSQDQQLTALPLQSIAHAHQVQQQKPGISKSQSRPSLPYTAEKGTGSYQSQPGPQSFTQESSTPPALNGSASDSSAMGLQASPYPGFANDPAYLGMQYALGASKAVQSGSSTYGTQLGVNQLEGPLTQDHVPNRIYTTYGRQA